MEDVKVLKDRLLHAKAGYAEVALDMELFQARGAQFKKQIFDLMQEIEKQSLPSAEAPAPEAVQKV